VSRALSPPDGSFAGARTAAAIDLDRGWKVHSVHQVAGYIACGAPGCRRGVFSRFPACRAAVITLTNDPGVDAGAIADRIARRIFTVRARAAN